MVSYLAWTFQGNVCSKVLCISLISQRFQLGKDMIKSFSKNLESYDAV